ncbi:HVA22-like protein e, variant 2 [Ancistrocladus abbreviatus]
MGRLWTLLTHSHTLAGPVMMLLYPLYASVMAIESPSKVDDEQWLAYWILYSFLTLMEMLLQPLLEWIPIWYTLKLVLVSWLVLPQFRGAAFIYERFVREKVIKKYGTLRDDRTTNGKGKSPPIKEKKFVQFILPKKVSSSILLFSCLSFFFECVVCTRPFG